MSAMEARGMRASPDESGMTIVEILVVLAIVALAASISVATIGSLGRTRLRSSSYLVAAAVQRGFSWAATHGEAVRLVIDLDDSTLTLEHGEGRLLVDKSVEGGVEEEMEEEGEPTEKEAAPAKAEGGFLPEFDLGVETLSEQIKSGFHQGEVPRYKPPVFKPIPDKRFEERELEPRIVFLGVYSPLYEEPKRDGKAFIYFFPDGMGDPAVIHLQNPGGQITSVEVQSLSGKARIYNYPFVPEFREEDEE